jgi:putative tryptophan/tyrosine transport system substrate-binding protein
MRRRHFLAAFGGAVVSWPCATFAKVPARIGFLASGAEASINSARIVKSIKQGLADNGLIESRDYVFEPRFAAGRYQRFPELARELAQASVSLILADTDAAARAAQQLVSPLPVVMVAIDDPVASGLVASLAKPGGTTTGLATMNRDLTQQMLELQRMILPKASSIAVLYNPANPANTALLKVLGERAGTTGLSTPPLGFQSREELEAAFRGLAAKRPDALQVIADSGTSEFNDRIAALALINRLPAFSNMPEFTSFGGLLAYGASRDQLYLRSGDFVKKILDGANAGELPVELPSRIELWVNQKTASALSVVIPQAVLTRADKVIE